MKLFASIVLAGFVAFAAPVAFACDCGKDKASTKCECGEKCDCKDHEGHSCNQKTCAAKKDAKTEEKKTDKK